MNLILDVGNTRVKYAIFKRNELVFRQETSLDEIVSTVKKICEEYPKIEWAILASVNTLDATIVTLLSIYCRLHQLSPKTKTPFKNSYATPGTLGADRMALATAAFYHNPSANTLVVDAGTCITYDMVNDYGEYLGGAISPGVQMRYKALHHQTARLPLLTPEEVPDFIGNATANSIHSGVLNGLCHEIDGFILQYKTRFSDLTVILTGGNAQFLSKRLKNTIFADSNFLLSGLNHLLEYNKH